MTTPHKEDMNSHKLLRLRASLRNRPHLISKNAFQEIEEYLSARNSGLMTFQDNEDTNVAPAIESAAGVGVITIRGPLTYRTSGWEAFCGGFSYEMLLEQAEELIESGAKTIVIDADSGGGECYGCFESTDELRQMCDNNGVKLIGYIDGCACSAMYAIICACDEVVINPYGEAGSIGVLICLYNDSKALEQAGYERTFITDGTDKVPFADDGTWREGFLADLQTRVAMLGDDFRSHVSKYTGLSVEDLKNTQARVYSAQDALSMGLVNKIMTRSEFVDYVLSQKD
jgi:ClpP class serine protease